MVIYLRTHTDPRGDAVDCSWFCSQSCYADSLREHPASVTLEEGGAYPCGAEHDLPDFCATCERPVGNPLTSEGEEYVREFVARTLEPPPFSMWRCYPYANATATRNAERLRAEYGYLFA